MLITIFFKFDSSLLIWSTIITVSPKLTNKSPLKSEVLKNVLTAIKAMPKNKSIKAKAAIEQKAEGEMDDMVLKAKLAELKWL